MTAEHVATPSERRALPEWDLVERIFFAEGDALAETEAAAVDTFDDLT